MSRRKMILTSVVLLAIIFIGGMLAYFTDVTDETTNVFTLGNVKITLTEPSWNPETGIDIAPNTEVDKDPTVTNTGSKDALIFVKVTLPYATVQKRGDSSAAAQQLYTYTTNAGWIEVGSPAIDEDNNTITHVYAYGTANAMNPISKDDAITLFNKVKLIDVEDISPLDNVTMNIVVKAYAIQKDTLETTSAANVWDLVKDK